MRKINVFFILLNLFVIISTNIFSKEDPYKPLLKIENNLEVKSKLYKDIIKSKQEFNFKTGKPIDFYIDFQLGVGSTSANITSAGNTGSYTTKSALGFTSGALFYLSLFDLFSFSSGISFDGKSFKVTPPSLPTPPQGYTTNETYITSNYLNIPINFNYGGMISDKIGLTFNGGPYFGILLSQPDVNSTGLGYKNFDFGINATLTGNYLIQYPLNLIFGVKFMYGGLNNLGSTSTVDKITTTNYSFFSGLRIAI